jgi:hypothetical protein
MARQYISKTAADWIIQIQKILGTVSGLDVHQGDR